jgi:CxxC motif-containing protein (DUF1111 family)
MKKITIISAIFFLVVRLSMCHKAETFPDGGYDERLSGGAATVFDATSHALTNAVDGLSARDGRVHEIGDQIFEQIFVAPPSPIFTGLGPVFNNIACINCHRNDGGGLPTAGFSNSGLLMRISQPGTDEFGGPLSVPGFGGQIQDQAVVGAQPEASLNIIYTDLPVTYADGTVVHLRKPDYSLVNPYIALPGTYLLSPRLAPPLIGMGLLEKIPESAILSFVDAGDKNQDGISGKANYIHNPFTNATELGRFGLKANTPSLLVQIATAYQQDMGVTSFVRTDESAAGQSQMSMIHGDVQPELVDSLLNYVNFYVKTLAVPARRNISDPNVQQGATLFSQINCSGCHRPTVQTGIDQTLPQISNQRIHPYTDLLVHDMGDGLADNRPDYLASGREWRTQPLWGVGLLEKTTGTAYFLHDGRARTLEEAILWHDGEAAKAKQQFLQLSKNDRDNLITFLKSL